MKRLVLLVLSMAPMAPIATGLPVQTRGGGEIEEARERWEAMSPEERTEMKRRFKELRGMDEQRRRELEERFERLRSAERSAVEDMSEPVRQKLDALPREERKEVVREFARDALMERGRRAREHLPPPLRERLEAAGPEALHRQVREMKRARQHEEKTGRALDKLGRELNLSQTEREELRDLPLDQREAKLLELHRRLVDDRVGRDGLPEWIEREEWESWRGLPEREFFERFEGRRRMRGVPELRGAFGPGRGRLEAGQERAERERESRVQLGELLRPDPDWRIELRGLSHAERRDEIARRVKARVLENLAQHPEVFSPGDLERLRGLEDQAFGEALRDHLRGGRQGPAGRPRGARREPGEGRR